jgi:drug/metabolite transporter (DMT)-like permease
VTPGRSALLGSLTVALAASLFGMLGVLSRTAYGFGLTPFALVAWRAGVGAIATAGFVAWGIRRGGRLVGWRSLDGRGRASLALAALMGATLNMAMFLAFARIPVAIVLLCFYLYPALVAGASALLGWERMDRARVVALVIALGGMIAVVVGGSGLGSGDGLDPVGVALSLSAAVSQAIFVLVSRHGYRSVPTGQATGVIIGASALIAGALAVAGDGAAALTFPFSDPDLLGLLLFAGLFAAAVPSFLFLSGIRRIGPVRAGILMLLEPFVGVALAALFLADAVTLVQAAGGAAILAAAVIIQRSHPSESTLMPAGEPEPEVEPEVRADGAAETAARADPEADPVAGPGPEAAAS